MRWLLGLLAALVLAGCASSTIDRGAVDADVYASCVRSGGIWYGDNQFGGSCRYQAPFR